MKKLIFILLLIPTLWYGLLTLVTREYTVFVTGKEVKNDQYLIFTDVTTFKVEDSYFMMNFNSSDMYGTTIQTNKCYVFGTVGFRMAFFSFYPNIRYVKDTKCNKHTSDINAEHQIKELINATNPEIRMDILNNLLYIRKMDKDFDKKYPNFFNQYQSEIKEIV